MKIIVVVVAALCMLSGLFALVTFKTIDGEAGRDLLQLAAIGFFGLALYLKR